MNQLEQTRRLLNSSKTGARRKYVSLNVTTDRSSKQEPKVGSGNMPQLQHCLHVQVAPSFIVRWTWIGHNNGQNSRRKKKSKTEGPHF